MNVLVKFDVAVISFLEKQLHRFQRLTGKTNFWVAKQICMLQIVLWGIFLIAIPFENFPPVWERSLLILICIGVSPLAFTIVYSRAKRCDQMEKDAFIRLENGVANKGKNMSVHRVFHVLILITFFLSISLEYRGLITRSAIQLIYFSDILRLYLMVCDPLPPCAGKIKEWLGSFKPAPALEPARVPNTRS